MKTTLLATFLAAAVLLGGSILHLSLQESSQPATWKEVLPKPEHTKVDESKPLRDQTRVVEIAGRTFEIPIMYFDTALDPGLKQDGLLLEVIYPDMRSIYELKDRAEYKRIKMQEHRVGWILLEEANARPTLDMQFSNRKNFVMRHEPVGKFGDLEKYLWYVNRGGKPQLQDEVYISRDDKGLIVDYIDCWRGPSVRFPGCSHKFIDGGLIYQISYNEAGFLKQWREQKHRAIDLLNKFELEAFTTGKENE